MSDEDRASDFYDGDDEGEDDLYGYAYAQVDYIFSYGVATSFSNEIKREAALTGDLQQDLSILVGNFIDFVSQIGITLETLRPAFDAIVDTIIEQQDNSNESAEDGFGPVKRDDSDNSDTAESESKREELRNAFVINNKAYEDVDDMVSDDEYFNTFVERFNSEDNLLFRKIVFKAFLTYVLSGGGESE